MHSHLPQCIGLTNTGDTFAFELHHAFIPHFDHALKVAHVAICKKNFNVLEFDNFVSFGIPYMSSINTSCHFPKINFVISQKNLSH